MSESAADFASKRSVVGVIDEMVKQKLVTLIVPSLVLDEIRRLGWICPSRLLATERQMRAVHVQGRDVRIDVLSHHGTCAGPRFKAARELAGHFRDHEPRMGQSTIHGGCYLPGVTFSAKRRTAATIRCGSVTWML